MAIVLHQSASVNISRGASNTAFFASGSGASLSADSIEVRRQVIIRTTGASSKLYINVIFNDRAASTLRYRKNAANGNQVVSITASTAGKFEDAANFDSLLVADLVNYQLITGGGGTNFILNCISTFFSSSVNTSQRLVAPLSSALGNNQELSLSGVGQAGGTASGNQVKIYGNGGTFKNLAVFLSSNTRDGISTFTMRKGGVNVNLNVTIPASTAGLFEDTVNSDVAVANDLFNYFFVRGGASGSIFFETFAVNFETTDRTFQVNNFSNKAQVAGATTFTVINGGNSNFTAIESEAQTEGRTPFTLTNLRAFIASNTIVAASTINVRKNTANGNLTVSITGLTNGAFEDVANSDSVVALDLLDVRFVGGAGGTDLTIRNINLTATVAATQDQYLPMMGIGS